MAPSDMPDYDNMSMEEIMQFMETLARRQGADESEFLTSANADIAEVDTSTVVDEPGYVPFGEDSKKPKKPAKPPKAAAPPPPPPPAPEPPPPPEREPEPPAAEPPAAAPPAGEIDYENMSMEEIMNFMETLAKRQGADESEFLTSANASVGEVDASTVVDEPGYVPFGEDSKKPKKPAKPAAAAPPPPPPPAPEPAPPTPEPVAPTGGLDFLDQLAGGGSSPADNDMSWLDSLSGGDSTPAGDMPDLSALDDLTAELGNLGDMTGAPASSSEGDTLSWLDSLTGGASAAPPEPSMDAVTDPLADGVDPMKWLESLAQRQGVANEELLTGGGMNLPDVDPTTATITGPGYDGYDVDNEGKSQPATPEPEPEYDVLDASDPAAWLGELANDPNVAGRVPGFDPNPAPSDPGKTTGDPIADMLQQGITPDADAMAAWMSGKMDELLSSEPLPLPDEEETPEPTPAFDPNAPATRTDLSALGIEFPMDMAAEPDPVPAADLSALGIEPPRDMPDFLSMDDSGTRSEAPPLSDEIVAPDDVPDMPDWLREDIPMGGDTLADIFDTAETNQAAPPPPVVKAKMEADPELLEQFDPNRHIESDNDPWVEALNAEHQMQLNQTDTLPDWYTLALNDPDRIREIEALAGPSLEAAALPPESNLPQGQREPLPDWLADAQLGVAPAAAASQPTAPAPAVVEPTGGMPDWLAEAQPEAEAEMPDWLSGDGEVVAAPADIPSWLLETIEDDEEVEPVQPQAIPQPVSQQAPPPQPAAQPTPPPQPVQRAPQPQPQAISPAPQPAYAANINVPEELAAARAGVQSGDLDGAMDHYEMVVRANKELGTVVGEVSQVIKSNKEYAPAYRVLGDALMRQGKLQDALNTYRRALNLL